MNMKFAKHAMMLLALAGIAGAQVTGAGSNPLTATRDKLNNATAPARNAANEALDATAPPSQTVVPAKPGAATAASAKVRPAASAKSSAAAPKTSPMTSKAASAKTTKPGAAKSAKAAPEMAKHAAGRRDPFVSVIVRASPNGPGASACDSGKRCLVIGQTSVKGVVKAANGMIAVVEGRGKTYFLRENDPVFDGFVLKITDDSVVFRENGMDNLGNQTTHEVVKSVNPPAA